MGGGLTIPRCEANATCGGGFGQCDPTGSVCECFDSNYADHSDFLRSNGCSVHLPTFRALWIILEIIWAVSLTLGVLAFYFVKRRTPESERLERLHISICLTTGLISAPTGIIELVSNGGVIAVDMSASVLYGLAQLISWVALLLKPSTRSENSIARFALVQTKAIMQWYFMLLPVLLALLFCSSLSVIVGAAMPDNEVAIIYAQFISISFAFLLVVNHIGIGAYLAHKQMRNALATSAMVTRRSSVKLRVEKFVKRATRTMFMTFCVTAALFTAPIVMLFCRSCWHEIWIYCPVYSTVCSLWILRAMINSLRFSLRNRRAAAKAVSDGGVVGGGVGDKHEQRLDSSAKDTPEARTSSAGKKKARPEQKGRNNVTATSSSSTSTSAALRTVKSKKRTMKKAAKAMTVVQEATYEGTVVMTQVDSALDGSGHPRSMRVAGIMREETVTEGEENGTAYTDGAVSSMSGGGHHAPTDKCPSSGAISE